MGLLSQPAGAGRFDFVPLGPPNWSVLFDRPRQTHGRNRMAEGPSDWDRSRDASDGHTYLSNNDGRTFVVQAGSEFRLLGENNLGERITASPAITGDSLNFAQTPGCFALAGHNTGLRHGS